MRPGGGGMRRKKPWRENPRHYTKINRYFVFVLLVMDLLVTLLTYAQSLRSTRYYDFSNLFNANTPWLLVFLVLLPLAMTMALLWKTKEVILESVFGTAR